MLINARYLLEGVTLGESVMKQYLTALVEQRLKNSTQCQATTKRSSRILICILKKYLFKVVVQAEDKK